MTLAKGRITALWLSVLIILWLCDACAQHLQLTPSESDVAYGDHPRQVLDFYGAESVVPAPVIVLLHPGGFNSGDKGQFAGSSLVRGLLRAGISVVAANYRLVVDRPGEPGFPYPAPMHDAARVVQFARSRAQDWHIDPLRVAIGGSSAGACMALWLGVQDDLADPDSEDPVARQSTRVSCVIGQNGQTTLDPRVILSTIGGRPKIHSSIVLLFSVDSMEDLEQHEPRRLIEEASALNHVTDDDPPLYLQYKLPLAGTPLPEDTSGTISIHHPMFGKLMKDRYDALGLECVFAHADQPADISIAEFLCDKLGVTAPE